MPRLSASRAGAFRAAASACLLLAVAAHAHADVLVSNIGQSDGDTGTLRIYDHAQGFTTGGNTAGYAVTSVEVKFADVVNSSLNLAVGIRSSDSLGNPGSSIGTFMNPDSFSSGSVSTFTASGSGIALEASTKYFVVVNSSSSNGESYLRNTARDSEDPVDAAGWTIDDVSRYKLRESVTWLSHPQSKMIRINGTEVVLQPLGMPRNVSAAAPERIRGLDFAGWVRADEIEVTWLEPFIGRGPAIAGYRVDVSSDGGASWRVLAPLVAGTSHVHRGLRARSTWHYRVRAVAAGGMEGPAAGVVQATTGHGVLDLEVTSRPAVGDTYRAGESIVVAVTMSTAMTYREPRLPLRVGAREREATCRVGAGSDGAVACPGTAATRLSLSYVVVAEDRDEVGIAVEADVLTGREFRRPGRIVADLGGVGALPHRALGPLSGHKVDGRPLRVSVADAPAVAEGDAAAFTVMLSAPAREPVTVVWSTVFDSTELRAAFGEGAPTYVDYTSVAAAMLTFAPGETQRTVSVPTRVDGRDEYEETFLVRLDSVQGGGAEIDASAAQARARIVDTDPAPVIEVVPALGAEGEALGFRVDLVSERPSARHLTLVWSTVDGTARAGSDYTAVVERTLTLAPGETRATLAVSTLDDAVREEEETFRVRVRYGSQSAPASEVEAVEAAGTIVDDDVPGRPGLPRGVVAEVRSVFDHRLRGLDPSRIDLSWTAPAGETEVTGYRVDVSADGGRGWRVLAPLVAGTSYAHEGLMPGETRHYRVRAVGAGGVEGLPAQVVQATTGGGIRRLEVTSRPAHGGVYRAGEEIVVTVHLADRWRFNDPRLPLLIGGRTRDAECREKIPYVGSSNVAHYCPGEQSSEIELSYVVVAEDHDEDGISVSADTLRGLLESAGASLVDLSQRLPHPGVGPLSGHEVDGRPLRVSVAGAPVVEEGEAAAFTVMLSEPAAEPVTVVWSTVFDSSAHGLESAAPGTELRAAFGVGAPTYVDYALVAAAMLTFAPGEDAARGVGSDPGGWTRRVRGDVPGAARLGAGGRRGGRRLGGAGEGAGRRHRPAAGHRGRAGARHGGRGAGVRGGSRVREALRPASDAGLVDGGRDGSGGVGLHRGGGADADPRTGTDAGDAGGAGPRRRGARGGGDVPGAGAVRVAVGAGIGGGGGRGRGDDRGRRRAGEGRACPGRWSRRRGSSGTWGVRTRRASTCRGRRRRGRRRSRGTGWTCRPTAGARGGCWRRWWRARATRTRG